MFEIGNIDAPRASMRHATCRGLLLVSGNAHHSLSRCGSLAGLEDCSASSSPIRHEAGVSGSRTAGASSICRTCRQCGAASPATAQSKALGVPIRNGFNL
jgi:hypothetical protein